MAFLDGVLVDEFGVVYVIWHFVGGWGLMDLGVCGKIVGQVLVGIVAPAPFLAVVALAYLLLLPSKKEGICGFLDGFGFAEALVLILVAYPPLQLVWTSIHEELLSARTPRALRWAGQARW